MDDLFAWLQAKIGPTTFGAIAGFILQVIISRPKDWQMALERAVAAFLMSMVFAPPLAQWLREGLFKIEAEYALIVAATLCAIGGIELLRSIRARLLKLAKGNDTRREGGDD